MNFFLSFFLLKIPHVHRSVTTRSMMRSLHSTSQFLQFMFRRNSRIKINMEHFHRGSALLGETETFRDGLLQRVTPKAERADDVIVSESKGSVREECLDGVLRRHVQQRSGGSVAFSASPEDGENGKVLGRDFGEHSREWSQRQSSRRIGGD